MEINWRWLGATVIIAILVGAAAYYYGTTVPREKPLTELTFIQQYITGGGSAHFYVSMAKGFYYEEGLSVAIVPSSGTTEVITTVESKKADIGQPDGLALINYLGQGAKLKSIFVASPYNTVGVAFFADQNIEEPKDLEGKTYGSPAWDVSKTLVKSAMTLAGADPDKLEVITVSTAVYYTAFFDREFNAMSGYGTGSWCILKVEAAKRGVDVRRIPLTEWGINSVGATFVVHPDTLEERPEVIRAFIRATIKGTQYALENKDEALEILYRYNPALDPEISDLQFDAWVSNIQEGGEPIGAFDADLVDSTIELAKEVFDTTQWTVDVTPELFYTDELLP